MRTEPLSAVDGISIFKGLFRMRRTANDSMPSSATTTTYPTVPMPHRCRALYYDAFLWIRTNAPAHSRELSRSRRMHANHIHIFHVHIRMQTVRVPSTEPKKRKKRENEGKSIEKITYCRERQRERNANDHHMMEQPSSMCTATNHMSARGPAFACELSNFFRSSMSAAATSLALTHTRARTPQHSISAANGVGYVCLDRNFPYSVGRSKIRT